MVAAAKCSPEDCPHTPDIREHHKSLYGNGREGLVVVVARLADRVKLLCWLSGAVTTALLGLICTLIALKIGA